MKHLRYVSLFFFCIFCAPTSLCMEKCDWWGATSPASIEGDEPELLEQYSEGDDQERAFEQAVQRARARLPVDLAIVNQRIKDIEQEKNDYPTLAHVYNAYLRLVKENRKLLIKKIYYEEFHLAHAINVKDPRIKERIAAIFRTLAIEPSQRTDNEEQIYRIQIRNQMIRMDMYLEQEKARLNARQDAQGVLRYRP